MVNTPRLKTLTQQYLLIGSYYIKIVSFRNFVLYTKCSSAIYTLFIYSKKTEVKNTTAITGIIEVNKK